MNAEFQNEQQFAQHTVILELTAGSHMYGTSGADSDTDTRGVFIPTPQFILGLHKFDHFRDRVNDRIYYSLRYYIQLLLKGVMDTHDWLWADSYSILTPVGKQLIALRQDALSDALGRKVCGYMLSAWKRIDRGDPAAWGEKRRKLFEQFGYDTKDASHAVRLAHQGIRLYEEAVFEPRLPEEHLAEIIDIKHGKVGLDAIRRRITDLDEELKLARERNAAGLPESPATKRFETFLISTYHECVR